MANLKVTLELDNQGYIRGIKASEDAVKQFAATSNTAVNNTTDSFLKLSNASEKLSVGFTRLKGLLIGGAFAAFARSAIASADAISDLSRATDLSIGRIIELQQALQASGGSSQDAAKVITEFYKSIEEAAAGTDKTQENFAKLGVSLDDLRKKSTADLLDDTIAGFEKIRDPAQKTALAIQMFGKSMQGVAPEDLAAALQQMRGQFDEQASSVERAAELNDKLASTMNTVKLAFLEAIEPLLDFVNNISVTKQQLKELVDILKVIAVVAAAAFGLTVFGKVATIIGSIGRGLAAIPSLFAKIASSGGAAFAVNGPLMTAMRAVAKLAGFIAGGVGAAVGLGMVGGEEDTGAGAGRGSAGMPQAQPGRGVAVATGNGVRGTTSVPGNRVVETGKELQSQLNSVQQIGAGYKRIVESNQQRLSLEAAIANLTKEEQDLYKGIADINKRANDTIAQLEEKRKGAKGETLAAIDREIANVKSLTKEEEKSFITSNQRVHARLREEQSIKNIIMMMEQMEEYNREIAQYYSQVDAAKVSAFEQVKNLKEATDLTKRREELEFSLRNLRSEDQDKAKKLFDLEEQRRQQLEAIRKIQNLPYDGVGGQKAREDEVNATLDAEKRRIEETAALRKTEQEDFVFGWQNALEKWRNNFKTQAEYASEMFNTLTRGFENAIVKFVQTGKLSFKDLFNSLIAMSTQMMANRMLMSLLGGGSSGFMSGQSGLLGGFGSWLSGLFKADGGPVNGGQSYVVGERGPELFRPRTAGNIIPNDKLAVGGGGGAVVTNVNYSIQAVDVNSFRSLVARDPAFIYSVTEQGRRSQPPRR